MPTDPAGEAADRPPEAADIKSHPLYLHFVKWLGDNRLGDTAGHGPAIERRLFSEFLVHRERKS